MILLGGLKKHINKGAYRGKLTCPVCSSEAIRFVEDVTPFRKRYRCRKCGSPFQYDIGFADPGAQPGTHPYAPFKKPKWQKVVADFERSKTRR